MSDFSENSEELKALVTRIEQKLDSKDSFYLDVEEICRVSNYYLEKGMTGKAMVILKVGLNLHPISSDIKLYLAQVHTANGEYPEALKYAELTLSIEPNNVEVLILKAEIYSYLGDHKKSIQYYEDFLEKGDKQNLDLVYNDIAWEFESLMDYENALKYLKLALESNPDEDTLLFEIAYFYEELNKHDECIEFYKKFLDENPYSFNGWYNLGIVYNELKHYKKAVSAFDYATLIKDDFTSAYFNKGNSHFNLCEYGEALECYYKTFELEDNQPITFCYVGECYEKMENYVEAEKSFELALTLNEDIQEALIGMAIIKDKQEQTSEAVPFVKKANRLYPKSSSCWYIAAEVYNKLNLFDEAYLAYAKADEFNSENNVQIILDFSNFMAENLSILESIDYLEKCEDPRAQYRLVAYYLLINKGKAAFTQLEKALSLDFKLHKELLDYHEEIMELPEFISLIEGFKS